ncbi:MAG: PIG-L family deacetylase [Bacteroidetes bacterium]|nr:PIG-L family deacetylase [Bacteroidota bacterium]
MKKHVGTLLVFFAAALTVSAQSPKRLLAIFAHPDDEQTVAPLLVKSVEDGVEVTLVIATDGRLGVNEYTDYEAGDGLAALRREELKCAAETLGVKLIHLNYHDQLRAAEGYDGHIPHVRSLLKEITAIVARVQPDAIVTWGPDGASNHMDHRLIGATVTQVFTSRNWGNDVQLYFFGIPSDILPSEEAVIQRGVERSLLNTQVAFEPRHLDAAYEALRCHASQYPSYVVDQIKKERQALEQKVFLRQFVAPKTAKNSLF